MEGLDGSIVRLTNAKYKFSAITGWNTPVIFYTKRAGFTVRSFLLTK